MDLGAEARRFDPEGEYVRRWLPVLARMPTQVGRWLLPANHTFNQ